MSAEQGDFEIKTESTNDPAKFVKWADPKTATMCWTEHASGCHSKIKSTSLFCEATARKKTGVSSVQFRAPCLPKQTAQSLAAKVEAHGLKAVIHLLPKTK